MKHHWKCPEWANFTELCKKKAQFRCEFCGKSETARITLQVHHPEYIAMRKPWQYPIEFCLVLCSGCHAREHGLIPPINGWHLLHSDWDFGESSGDWMCERPGCNRDIKWHNVLFHPLWGEMTVGYECAEFLQSPELHEAKKRYKKRRTFVESPFWKATPNGLSYKHGFRDIFIYRHPECFKLKINGRWGSIPYRTVKEAKWKAAQVVIPS